MYLGRMVLARLAILGLLLVAGCKQKTASAPAPAPSAATSSPRPTGDKVVVTVAYGSEKKRWLEEQAAAFAKTAPSVAGGRPIEVKLVAQGSGEALRGIVSGSSRPTVFSPASSVYLPLLNEAWAAKTARDRPLVTAGEPLVLSPVVVAMWRPMAEALGWPDKQLGWADLLAVNANPRGWGAFGHEEWGRFKLGHTHPEHSNSGLLAVLAEAYAGAGKTRGLTVADLDDPRTRKLVAAVEGTIVHYGKSTGFFADKMRERGPTYLSAAVLYENLVIESYEKPGAVPLVALYPKEGTFWSDHPYAILDAEWVGPPEREAAELLLAFLRARPAQERALALGFRPGDPAIAMGAPIDAAHGVDAKQPETLLEVPAAATLARLIELWRENKKSTDVILVFDKSGSMAGRPLTQAKDGARTFLAALAPSDEATLLFFDSRVATPLGPLRIAEGRERLLAAVAGVNADGGTALYDALVAAAELSRARAAKNPGRIHAIVVMTDGKDENSRLALDAVKGRLRGGDIRLFTIAYGDGGAQSRGVLVALAEAAGGAHQDGGVESIVGIFEEMAAFL